jgi:UPF0271 protein
MPVRSVDLNADLGESYGRWTLGDDEALLGVVTSANIACGFHAGDPTTLVAACRSAAERGVAIGAQVGYADLRGFGRRFVDVEPDDLYADVLYQIGALDGIARAHGSRVSYVKPHGALYNATVHHTGQAGAVVRAVADYTDRLAVLGLPGSALLAEAEAGGLPTVAEAFADRAYAPDGTLVPRRRPGAVIADTERIVERVLRMVAENKVDAVDGSAIVIHADSICVHGDTPGAVRAATAIRAALSDNGITVARFTEESG